MADEDTSKVKEVTYEPPADHAGGGLVEEVTAAAKSVLEDAAAKSSSYVESLVPSFKTLGGGAASEDPLPTSDKNVGEPPAAAATAAPREGFVATGSQASWKNCCGLLDFLQGSDR
ncbi:uncharacterized protein LOC127254256 isoform X3 [Andrographis paniculata]|uniref:uncharacterized protein LOC127254256 isoform X3 n=1 Tax=Andrographis paniculata TaxID=175694 RepID=UPI0021E85252|nr:uncharacterized protein LOC127254256 isoform X3 [Andrographis paniculata]